MIIQFKKIIFISLFLDSLTIFGMEQDFNNNNSQKLRRTTDLVRNVNNNNVIIPKNHRLNATNAQCIRAWLSTEIYNDNVYYVLPAEIRTKIREAIKNNLKFDKQNCIIGETKYWSHFAFNPKGNLLVTPAYTGISVYDSSNLYDINEISHYYDTKSVSKTIFNPQSTLLACILSHINGLHNIHILDITDAKQIRSIATLIGHNYYLTDLKFSSNGNLLASSSRDGIKVWDISNVENIGQVAFLTDHQSDVCTVAFHPTKPLLASGSIDETIKIWDLSNIQNISNIATLIGHKYRVNEVAFHPNQEFLASISEDDGTIKIWDLNNLSNITCHTSIEGEVVVGRVGKTITFSPSGNLLVASAHSGILKIWDSTHIPHLSKPTKIKTRSSSRSINFLNGEKILVSHGDSSTTFINLWLLLSHKKLSLEQRLLLTAAADSKKNKQTFDLEYHEIGAFNSLPASVQQMISLSEQSKTAMQNQMQIEQNQSRNNNNNNN